MTSPGPALPRRGLRYARSTCGDGGSQITAECVCGTKRTLTVSAVGITELPEPKQVPFTCAGCGAQHCVTAYPVREAPQ